MINKFLIQESRLYYELYCIVNISLKIGQIIINSGNGHLGIIRVNITEKVL